MDAEKKPFDYLDFIMRYESEYLDEDEIIAGFQELVNSGIVWQLQGAYGRKAQELINEGFITDGR